MDACLQVKGRGYRVLFDFANVVEHYPGPETMSAPGRNGDLAAKVFVEAGTGYDVPTQQDAKRVSVIIVDPGT